MSDDSLQSILSRADDHLARPVTPRLDLSQKTGVVGAGVLSSEGMRNRLGVTPTGFAALDAAQEAIAADKAARTARLRRAIQGGSLALNARKAAARAVVQMQYPDADEKGLQLATRLELGTENQVSGSVRLKNRLDLLRAAQPSDGMGDPRLTGTEGLEAQIAGSDRRRAMNHYLGRAIDAYRNGDIGTSRAVLGFGLRGDNINQIYRGIGQMADGFTGGMVNAQMDQNVDDQGNPYSLSRRNAVMSEYGQYATNAVTLGLGATQGLFRGSVGLAGKGIEALEQAISKADIGLQMGHAATIAADPTLSPEERKGALLSAGIMGLLGSGHIVKALADLPASRRAAEVVRLVPELEGVTDRAFTDRVLNAVKGGADPRDIRMLLGQDLTRADFDARRAAQVGAKVTRTDTLGMDVHPESGRITGINEGEFDPATGNVTVRDDAHGSHLSHELEHKIEQDHGLGAETLKGILGPEGWQAVKDAAYARAVREARAQGVGDAGAAEYGKYYASDPEVSRFLISKYLDGTLDGVGKRGAQKAAVRQVSALFDERKIGESGGARAVDYDQAAAHGLVDGSAIDEAGRRRDNRLVEAGDRLDVSRSGGTVDQRAAVGAPELVRGVKDADGFVGLTSDELGRLDAIDAEHKAATEKVYPTNQLGDEAKAKAAADRDTARSSLLSEARAREVDSRREAIGQQPEKIEKVNTSAEATSKKPALGGVVVGESESFTPDGSTKIPVRLKVVERSDLTVSHDVAGAANPDYPGFAQPRDRSLPGERGKVDDQARALNSDLLLNDFRSTDRGAPVVGFDGVVESGNGRILTLDRAKELNPEGHKAYVDAIRARHPEAAAIKDPVLVQERVGPIDDETRAKVAGASNESSSSSMNAVETARQDTGRLPEGIADRFELTGRNVEESLQSPGNKALLSAFIDKLPATERASMFDTDGGFSMAAKSRFARAIAAKALGHGAQDVLYRIHLEGDVMQRITRGLEMSSTELLRMRAAADAGNEVAAGMSDSIVQALRYADEARGKMGGKAAEWFEQGALSGLRDPDAMRIGKMLVEAPNQEASADLVRSLARAASDSDGGMFGDEEAFKSVREAVDSLFGEGSIAPDVQRSKSFGGDYTSKARQVVEEKAPGRARVGDVVAMLKGAGIKEDEIRTQLGSLLDDPDARITKDELKAFMNSNGVKVEETLRGAPDAPRYENFDAFARRNDLTEKERWDEYDNKGPLFQEWHATNEARNRAMAGSSAPKYASYTLPGRPTNQYGELLLRLPEGRAEGDFESAHWDEPNILAHARFQTIETHGQGKTLLLEEVQSDWHQGGRKSGYGPGEGGGTVVRHNGDGLYGFGIRRGDGEVTGSWDTLAEAQRFLEGGEFPEAPFKKTWHELVLRRMIKWAADRGMTRIAWPEGEVHTDRYDLRKQVDSLVYDPSTGELIGAKDRRTVHRGNYPPEKLPGVVGESVAQKLLAEPLGPTGTHMLEGERLDVGGDGMKGFYDGILPAYANKYGKKFGSQVQTIAIPTEDGPVNAHALDITPEMAAAAKEGVPLWSKSFGDEADAGGKQSAIARILDRLGVSRIGRDDGRTEVSPAPRSTRPATSTDPGVNNSERVITSEPTAPDEMALQRRPDFELSKEQEAQEGIGSQMRQSDVALLGEGRGVEFEGKTYRSWDEARKLGTVLNDRDDILKRLGAKDPGAGISDVERAAAFEEFGDLDARLDALDRQAAEARDAGDNQAAAMHEAERDGLQERYSELAGKVMDLTSDNGRNLAATRMFIDTVGGDVTRNLRRARSEAKRKLTAAESKKVSAAARAYGSLSEAVDKERARMVLDAENALAGHRGATISLKDLGKAKQRSAAGTMTAPKLSPVEALTRIAQGMAAQGAVDPVLLKKYAADRLGITLEDDAAAELMRRGGERHANPKPETPTEEAAQQAKKKLQQAHADVAETTGREFLESVYRAGLLSTLRAAQASLGGNAVSRVLDDVARMPAVMIDSVLSLRTKERTVSMAGTVAGERASYSRKAAESALDAILHGSDAGELGKLDQPKKIDYKISGGRTEGARSLLRPLDPVTRAVSWGINKVFDLLTAADRPARYGEMARGLIEQATLDAKNEGLKGEAVRTYVRSKLGANPDPGLILRAAMAQSDAKPGSLRDLVKRAKHQAEEAILANESPATKAAAAIGQIPIAGPLFLPFPRIPTNAVAKGLEWSPAGVVYGLARTLQTLHAGDPGAQKAAANALARGTLGSTALLYLGYKGRELGYISGPTSTDQGMRATEEAAGQQGSSVKVGSRWLSYRDVPQLMVVGMGAALYDAQQGAKVQGKGWTPNDTAAALVGGAADSSMDLPTLQSAKDATQALQEAERAKGDGQSPLDAFKDSRLVTGFGGSIIPKGAQDATTAGDDLQRESSSFSERFQSGTSGRKDLPAKVDALGKPLKRTAGFLSQVRGLGPDQADRMADPLAQELLRLHVPMTPPQKVRSPDRADRDKNAADFAERKAVVGTALDRELRRVISTEFYKNASDKARRDELLAVRKEARGGAVADLRDQRERKRR